MAKSIAAEFVAPKSPIRHLLDRVNFSSPYLTKAILLALSVVLLFGAAAVVYTRSDWTAVAARLAQLSWLPIATAFALMLAGGLLASLRLKLIAGDLGYRLSFRDAVSALGLGHLAGILFFQVAGQLMARGLLLSRRRIPVSGTIVVTGYERLVALAVSFVLAALGAIFIFGRISINTAEGGIPVIKIFLGLLTVGICGAIFCWGGLVAKNVPQLNTATVLKLGRNIGLSLLIQLATMAAYVVLLRAIVPEIPVLRLSAASALVMFAASLPISFSGWGMRELSAIIAMGTIGVAADAAFAVAAMVGVISILVVGLMTVAAIHHHHQPAPIHPRAEALRFDFGVLLDYGLPLIAATAVFFQVFVPVNKGAISVNLADPAVILGGCLFVLHNLKKGWPHWRISHFEIYVGLTTLLIVTAFLHGLDRFGWTNWAFTNRLLGWFVLLAYGATGALIVHRAHRQGLDLLLRTFVIAAISIVGFELVLLVLYVFGAKFLKSLVQIPFVGFSVNKNAYSLQLIFAVCAILAARWKNQTALLGIVFVGIWFAGSRAGVIALPVVLAVAAYLRCLPLRATLLAFVLAITVTAFICAIPKLAEYLAATNATPIDTDALINVLAVVSPGSDTEHMTSLIDGWAMFVSHPIFGAGLGAFMSQEIQKGTPLVIHSTPLWLLAEMGLLGLLVMLAPIVRIFCCEMQHRKTDIAGRILVLIITAFAVVANVHEIMYQRAFWLLLGASLAYVPHRHQLASVAPEGRSA
jgi:Lysylphosphatidylglycerol synthase TM region/O-Antigen ligase